jgi:cytochrome P450
MEIVYSPYDERVMADPWATYRRMQDDAPAYYIPDLDCWALSRFEDIWQASMDRHSYTAGHGTSPDALFLASAPPPSVFLFMDPPAHGVHRGMIAKSYQKDKIATIDAHVRAIVRELLMPALETGRIEVYRLASRVALFVIADFIGLTREEILHIRGLIDRFYTREPGVRGTTPAGAQAFAEAHDYIHGLIGKYRRQPPASHSHINTWLHALAADTTMTDEEIFFSIFAMVITGSDTVPLTTASCVYYLDQFPDQQALARRDPALLAGAFEETARYDQPTNLLGRRLVRDVELHGQTMREGQSVLFLYAAAGRDGREFEQPDSFNIERKMRRTLAFGTGIHFCLGQHLARLEGRIILEELMASIPEFAVERAACRRVYGEFLQSYCSVPISFKPR